MIGATAGFRISSTTRAANPKGTQLVQNSTVFQNIFWIDVDYFGAIWNPWLPRQKSDHRKFCASFFGTISAAASVATAQFFGAPHPKESSNSSNHHFNITKAIPPQFKTYLDFSLRYCWPSMMIYSLNDFLFGASTWTRFCACLVPVWGWTILRFRSSGVATAYPGVASWQTLSIYRAIAGKSELSWREANKVPTFPRNFSLIFIDVRFPAKILVLEPFGRGRSRAKRPKRPLWWPFPSPGQSHPSVEFLAVLKTNCYSFSGFGQPPGTGLNFYFSEFLMMMDQCLARILDPELTAEIGRLLFLAGSKIRFWSDGFAIWSGCNFSDFLTKDDFWANLDVATSRDFLCGALKRQLTVVNSGLFRRRNRGNEQDRRKGRGGGHHGHPGHRGQFLISLSRENFYSGIGKLGLAGVFRANWWLGVWANERGALQPERETANLSGPTDGHDIFFSVRLRVFRGQQHHDHMKGVPTDFNQFPND